MVDLLAQDKLLHVVAGVIIYGGCSLLYSNPVCLGVVAAAGIGKEVIYDKLLDKGTPEVLDAAATIAGGLISYGITFTF